MTKLIPEQQAIVDHVLKAESSLVVTAGPGTGKTFTNVETMKHGGLGYKMGIAFNKAIADELRVKAPPGVEVKTTHSVGLQMCKQRFRSKVNPASPYSKNSKPYKIIQRTFPNKFAKEFGAIAAVLVSGMDACGFGADITSSDAPGYNAADWAELVGDLMLEADERREIIARLPKALELNMSETEEISFSDMLLMPLLYDLQPPFAQTRIWGDEIQDWNRTQLRLVEKLTNHNTLVYGFGDPYQSIYAFRGADIHAVDNFANTFACDKLPLHTSFRCPVSVVEIAQQRNPMLLPFDDRLGVVDRLDKVTVEDCDDDTMVLCRFNAPLFSFGLRFLACGRSVRVSSSLPSSLKAVIRSLKTDDMTVFKERLEIWFRDQLEYAGDNHHLAGSANDKYAALVALHKHSVYVTDMFANIDRLTRGNEGPLLSTVHKAKGLEASRVIILKSSQLTWPGDNNPRSSCLEDDEQEWNIWYVAVTRAKDELFFA